MWNGSDEDITMIGTTDKFNYQEKINIDIDNDESVSNYGACIFERIKYINELQNKQIKLDTIEIDQRKIDRYHEINEILMSGFTERSEEKVKKRGFFARFRLEKESPIQSRKKLLAEYEELLDYIEDISKRQLKNAEKEKDRITEIYFACQELLQVFDMYIEYGNNLYHYYMNSSKEYNKLEGRKANLENLYARLSFLQNMREWLQGDLKTIELEQIAKKSALIKFRNKYDKLTMTRFTLSLENLSVNFSEQIAIIKTLEESCDAIILSYIEQVGQNCEQTAALHNERMLGSNVIAALEETIAKNEAINFSNPLGLEFDIDLPKLEDNGFTKKKK